MNNMNPMIKKLLIYTGIGMGGICIGTQIPRSQKQAPSPPEIIPRNLFPLISKHEGENMEFHEENRLLSKGFCESFLKRLYKNDDIKVTEVKGGDRTSLQQSFMSEVNKCKLSGFNGDAQFQLDVIVKVLHSKDHQELYKSDIAAQNEAVAYNTIFPHLNVYEDTSLPVPICYSAKDDKIIVEDLCAVHRGYKVFDKKRGHIDPIECVYILKALAKFHAASIVLKHKNNEDFEKIKNVTKEILYSNPDSLLLKHQQDSLKNIVAIYKRREPTEENLKRIAALENLIRVAKYDIKDLLSEEKDTNVFCHGDLLLTNFLYKLNERNTKDGVTADMDIKFVDFQKVLYGSIASDLAYLLFVNLQPDDYIHSKEYFIHKYLSYLKKNIEDCGVTVDPKLNYSWLLNEVDRFTEYGIIYALWILPMFANDDIQDWKEVTKEMLAENSQKKFINERMEKWVDYYSEVFEKKSKQQLA